MPAVSAKYKRQRSRLSYSWGKARRRKQSTNASEIGKASLGETLACVSKVQTLVKSAKFGSNDRKSSRGAKGEHSCRALVDFTRAFVLLTSG